VGRNWYQSIHCDKMSCRQVSFFGPKWTPSREEHKVFQRPYILTLSQSVGLMQFASVEKFVRIFFKASCGVKISQKYADERINASMRSLFVLCVGGIEAAYASWREWGGGGMEP
jgi:hypothetical protein